MVISGVCSSNIHIIFSKKDTTKNLSIKLVTM